MVYLGQKQIATLIQYPIFLMGLQKLLQSLQNIHNIGNIKEDELQELMKFDRPNILFVSLKDDHIYEKQLISNLHIMYPELKIGIFREQADARTIHTLFKTGASAIMLRNIREIELNYAIDVMIGGGTYVSQDISSGIFNVEEAGSEETIHHQIKKHRLTSRELQIMQMIVKELTNLEISIRLNISPRTVETHRMNIITKIGAKNSIGIAKFYLHNQLNRIMEFENSLI